VDVYTDPVMQTVYRTAEAAGNLLAARTLKTPIEDANAVGFGTITSQPPASQNVRGRGVWVGGSWNVLFVRELRSRDKQDVQFRPGRSVPVAFAIWNGAQRDRNGRKVVSHWFQLILNP
jgi:DMSO reductase family type II enzyme heme b subunit